MSDIQKEIIREIKELYIDCPACAGVTDNDQYTCTTCWHEGGDGKILVWTWIKENKFN